MADASLEWNDDLIVDATGDILLVEGSDETRQSIVRRLFTSVGAYIWAPEYGAGLIDRIGRPARSSVIQSIVRAQMNLEATVARVPVPSVIVKENTANSGLFEIAIRYTDAVTGAPVAISLEVPGSR